MQPLLPLALSRSRPTLLKYVLAALSEEISSLSPQTERDVDRRISRLVGLFMARASIYLQLDLLDMALADANRAIGLLPSHAAAYHIRCLIYATGRQYQRAIADSTEALTLLQRESEHHENLALLYYTRAVLHACEGAYMDAISDLQRASTLQPHQPHITYLLSHLQQLQKRTRKL